MVIGKTSHLGCAANFLRGRKCIFCGSYKTCHTSRDYVKCNVCQRQKSLPQLRREIAIIRGFYQLQPAHRVGQDLAVAYPTVSRVYQRLRNLLASIAELEGTPLRGEIEIDESYFGGHRKGKRGRGAAGKRVVLGLLEREGKVYTTVVEDVSAEKLLGHIQAHTCKGSVYYTDTFHSYNSLKHLGTHRRVEHRTHMVDPTTRNHINGIEGFWSYAKHVLYNYRGVSKTHFPMYLKEIGYRFNHRKENLFKLFLQTYFSSSVIDS
jgi:transposase